MNRSGMSNTNNTPRNTPTDAQWKRHKQHGRWTTTTQTSNGVHDNPTCKGINYQDSWKNKELWLGPDQRRFYAQTSITITTTITPLPPTRVKPRDPTNNRTRPLHRPRVLRFLYPTQWNYIKCWWTMMSQVHTTLTPQLLWHIQRKNWCSTWKKYNPVKSQNLSNCPLHDGPTGSHLQQCRVLVLVLLQVHRGHNWVQHQEMYCLFVRFV